MPERDHRVSRPQSVPLPDDETGRCGACPGMARLVRLRAIPGQDVPYEPTPMPVVLALLELAGVGPQDVVYDLGPGTAASRSPRQKCLARAVWGSRSIPHWC